MRYSEAFHRLGYDLAVPRQDWTAANEAGVCLSLWREGVKRTGEQLTYDSQYRDRDEIAWMAKPGHKKRTEHLAQALSSYEGFVDVVIVDGVAGQSVEDADPWVVASRKNRKWRVVKFEPSTGHFCVETQPTNNSPNRAQS